MIECYMLLEEIFKHFLFNHIYHYYFILFDLKRVFHFQSKLEFHIGLNSMLNGVNS